ncbi:MAG TPA: trigger factor [Candidatus Omnitrophota bacterium]|nr:trigger factor [Candidatus Omnitrophota bacterium]
MMKVEVKKVDATRRELKFEIPKDRVSQRMEEVYGEILKVAKIRGFRPGKAPRHLVEQEHGKIAQEKMMERLIPEVYQEAIKKESLSPIDFPDIHDVQLKDGTLFFTASLDIQPEFMVKDYKGIKVQRKSAQVSEEEINKTLDFFKTAQGKEKEAKIDDEFAKGLGYPSLEELKTSFKRQMELEKDRQNRADIENQVIDFLIKNTKLVVPKTTIERHLQRLVDNAKQRLERQNMKPEEMEKRLEEFTKNMRPNAERDVKAYFILEKIAQQEQMKFEEGENVFQKVIGFLLKEAQWEEAKEDGKK